MRWDGFISSECLERCKELVVEKWGVGGGLLL